MGAPKTVVEKRDVYVVTVGEAGPRGEQGIPGVGGAEAMAAIAALDVRVTALEQGSSYIHYQGSASAVWTITHNLNRYPAVTIVDSALTQVEGDITYNSLNQCTVEFSAPFSGSAFCN